jgi:hypothetical protein
MGLNNELPSLNILGSVSFTPAFPRTYTQNSFVFSDVLSLFRGAHAIKVGGSLTRLQINIRLPGTGSFLQFLGWPDFLLGLDATGNGTERFSNVYASADVYGLLDRQYRAWEGSAYVQDNIRINKAMTLQTGLRYERVGQFGDRSGRNSSFDASKADASPPPGGSMDGYMVASNFPYPTPPGVSRAENTFGNYGVGQDTIAPRIGIAWQVLPNTRNLVLRAGYGLYYSRQQHFKLHFSSRFPPRVHSHIFRRTLQIA